MKRYSLRECARNGESWMEVVPSVNGEWVRVEDVDTLVKELEDKKEQCRNACEANLSLMSTLRSMQDDFCKLRNDLYEAKAKAERYKKILTGGE